MWPEILLAVMSLLILWKLCQKPPGLPPGPWGIPLLGHIPLGGKHIDHVLEDLHKKHGDVYMWRFGTKIQVYIHDYHLVKQVLGSPDYVDRPDMEMFKVFEEVPLGVSGSNGNIWNTNRRLCLRHLRDLGMGKSSLVSAVQEQAQILLEALKKESDGKLGPIPSALSFVIMNVIWKMTANKHFDVESPKHIHLQKLISQALAASTALALADMMPWVRRVFPYFIFRRIFKEDNVRLIINDFSVFFNEMIAEHKVNLDLDDPKDLIDACLIEMKNHKGDQPEDDLIRSDANLRLILFDVLFAGSDSTTTTLKWIILYMVAHPETQRKLQEEIDEVLPIGTLAALEDKPRLPYTEAVINEVIRLSNFANIGVPHSPSIDMTLAGYKIPKGTLVTAVMPSIHLDPRYWEKPEHFMPERWLSSEGKFVMKKEGFIPFGTGKRACIGESLARMELLIFTTAIFQNFTINLPEGKTVDLLPDHNVMMAHIPKNQDVLFSSRH